MTMKCVFAFLSFSLLCVYAGLIQSPAEVQLFLLQLRVQFLTNKHYERCPELIKNEGFLRVRVWDSLTIQQNIESELQIYKYVLALMSECNEQQSNSTNSTWPTNTTTTTMRTTTATLLNALPLLPSSLLKAGETTGMALLWVIVTLTFWNPVWHGSASL